MPTNPEQLLISSILRDADMTTATKHGVSLDNFHAYYDEWEWIESYYTKYRKTPSKVAFKEAFPEFVVKAVNDTGHYADEVRRHHARAALTASMRDVADLIAAGDIDAAVAATQASVVQISAGMGTLDDSDILTDWEGTYAEVEARYHRVQAKGSAGVPTGFVTLDERTGGFQPGHLWIVGARLGQGKSWTMMRMATAAVMMGYNVQYNSLEMSRTEVGMRIHTFLSNEVGQELFRNLDLQQGRNFDLKKYKKFLRELKAQVPGKLHVADASRGRVSPLTIAGQIERNQPDIVFVDYLTLMEKKGAGDWQSIAQLSGEMKVMANEYQVPIVAASQLNRAMGLTREPAGPEALAQGDSIGQDADGVITMRQDSESVITMKMAKYRHGPGGYKWYVEFKPTAGVMREVTYDQMLDIKDTDDANRDAS